MLKCWTFFIDIQRVCFSAPSACLSPFPSACHSPILPQEISQDWYLKQGRHKRGPVGDCIACDPPKKDGQGFKRTWSFCYCRELGGFVSCRLLWALPTPSSRMTHTQHHDDPHPAPWATPSSTIHTLLHGDPHLAPWWPTPSSMATHTHLHNDPHPAPRWPTREEHTWWVRATWASAMDTGVDPQEVIIIYNLLMYNCIFMCLSINYTLCACLCVWMCEWCLHLLFLVQHILGPDHKFVFQISCAC